MDTEQAIAPEAIAITDARAAAWLARLRLIPLYALHLSLLLVAAIVFTAASLYQVTLNAWRDGRKSLIAPDEPPVIITSIPRSQ